MIPNENPYDDKDCLSSVESDKSLTWMNEDCKYKLRLQLRQLWKWWCRNISVKSEYRSKQSQFGRKTVFGHILFFMNCRE